MREIDRALFHRWPNLRQCVPIVELGVFPTPVEPLDGVVDAIGRRGFQAYVKRDDLSSPLYGGNKVRTLEVLFGAAVRQGASHIYATGAYGSNHALAAVLHAPRAGLRPGVALFPQPASPCATENLEATLSLRPLVVPLLHWSMLPAGIVRLRLEHLRRRERAVIMVPGGATPEGALGYVSAALELAEQVEQGLLPRPSSVIVGVGSTCTSAGLLVGFLHAARLGIGFRNREGAPAPPKLISVRVTPWPVTSPLRIAWLALRTSRLLARLSSDPAMALDYSSLRRHLEVDPRFLGSGYGMVTAAGREAARVFEAAAGFPLDTTYSAKAAASLLWRVRRRARGPLLFWSTKSTAPLPAACPEALRTAPRPMRRWLIEAPRED